MKIQKRLSVFETNSSMSHTLQMMSKEEYDDLIEKDKSGIYAWDCDNEKWVDKNSEEYDEDDWCFRDSYFDEEADYEIEEYETPSGDVVVAISRAKEDY